jgi:hypothetical protein
MLQLPRPLCLTLFKFRVALRVAVQFIFPTQPIFGQTWNIFGRRAIMIFAIASFALDVAGVRAAGYRWG